MKTEVRYNVEDVEGVQELYQTYSWWEDREREDVRRALEATDEVVALYDTEDGTLVASGRVLTDYVYHGKILDVIVDEPHRGSGLGRRLMEAIVEHPDLQSVEVLTLNCRAGLVPFYEDFGFEVHDMTVELDGTEEDYYVMVRSAPSS